MNIPNILTLAARLEAKDPPLFNGFPIGFNMVIAEPTANIPDLTGQKCQASCCMIGWIHILRGADPEQETSFEAREWLGISADQARSLFFENITATSMQAACVTSQPRAVSIGQRPETHDPGPKPTFPGEFEGKINCQTPFLFLSNRRMLLSQRHVPHHSDGLRARRLK